MIRAQPIHLESAPKCGPSGQHRTVSARQTWRRLRPLLGTIGITRLADITGLDHLGVPTFSAVRPRAARFGVTVTCGKGLSGIDAMVGAVMECVEYRATEPNDVRGIVARIDQLDGPAVDPRDLILPPWVTKVDSHRYEWVEGWDLAGGEAVWVPAAAVYCEDPRGDFLFETNTNGVAAGNRLEEAIFHALAELVERDAGSIARSHFLCDSAQDRFPSLDLEELPPIALGIVRRFRDRGVELYVRDFTSDLGVPTFEVAALELQAGQILLHGGSGAHWVAEIALLRALTETAQSRAADIQGSREDLSVMRRRAPKEVDRESWTLRTDGRRRFEEVPDHRSSDVRDDILRLMERLAEQGLGRVVVVDLTDEDLGVPTVKVVVPGLEVFEVDPWRRGPRLSEALPAAAVAAS